jgi:hypothetical protein
LVRQFGREHLPTSPAPSTVAGLTATALRAHDRMRAHADHARERARLREAQRSMGRVAPQARQVCTSEMQSINASDLEAASFVRSAPGGTGGGRPQNLRAFGLTEQARDHRALGSWPGRR